MATRRYEGTPTALVVAVAVVVFALVVAGALMLLRRDDAAEPAAGVGGDVPGVAHVHGLGINPADGSLVVATHLGSFRIPPGGTAERIGDSYQDTMGFTVTGADRFLGSGHPDVAGMEEGQPGRLGLIESTDAGNSWSPLSLSGEADFHGLAFVQDQVYGWDAGTGRFMVSTDRQEWETRSTLDLVGFAVDPADPDLLVGATPDGLVESVDGGRSWNDTDGPALVALSWSPEAGLWGADSQGDVWNRVGRQWERAGSLPGQPQAFLATEDALYAAVLEDGGLTGIYGSADDGASWDLRYRDPSP